MDEQTNRPAPPQVLESLDASVADIAAGRVHDALRVQAEAHRLLSDHLGERVSGALQVRATGHTRSRP